MRVFARGIVLIFFVLAPSFSVFAEEAVPPPPAEPQANHIFRDQFYLNSAQKIRNNTIQAGDFLVVERSNPEWNSNISIVSDFAPQAVRTRVLKDIQTVDQAKEWIEKEKQTIPFEDVPIQKLVLTLPAGGTKEMFWVGNKSFDSYDQAAAQVAMAQSVIEMQGGNFTRAVQLAKESVEPEPAPAPSEPVKTRAQYEKEEQIALKWADQLDIGESLWGPFHGVPAGEPILYQSFGETSWRATNLAKNSFNSEVAFWTNRFVFKGIRFPLSTIDPYVEATVAPESTGNDGANQLDTVVGAEWRPLVRNQWFENFMPWGLQLLKFAKNYRFFAQYMERRNLKDEIANIRDYDFRFGVDIFYDWGIDLSPVDQTPRKGFAGFLSDHSWGEYYGNYAWRYTNFTAEEDFDAWIFDSSLVLGAKVPVMKLPRNPLNDELLLMPYFRFAMIYNAKLSNPADNRYYVSVGVRWMPFRDYRFVNNEWLFKTKIFAEYLAIGKVQNYHTDDGVPLPDEDWRIGVGWSLRRF